MWRAGKESAGRKRSEPTPKTKWGRHCCRPHCHRRVGSEERFTPDVSLQPRKAGSYVARRSRRCRFRRGPGMIRGSFPCVRAVPRPFSWSVSHGSAMRGIDALSKPAGSAACRLRALAASTVWKLRHPKMPWLSSLHRAASRHRVERGSEISSSFRVLPRPFEEPIPALDVWRMRLRAESGNSEPADLSTFSGNASGQGWISQPFVAKAAVYPRSRLASRRRRRALSLMKPSASCWS